MIDNDAREAAHSAAAVDTLDSETSLPAEAAPARWHLWGEIRALVRDLIFAALAAIVLLVFVVQPVKVEGTSMLPRLHDGERIFVNKFLYSLDKWPSETWSIGRPIRRGDIVVFWFPRDPSKSFIKRVIGLPGETVRIDPDGSVYINGRRLDEPYLSSEFTRAPQKSIVRRIKEHRFFVMGDNRDFSNDSRQWGQVPEKYIYGRAWFRYWPLDELESLDE